MAIQYSDQANAILNSANAHVEPNELQGRKRIAYFSYTVDDAAALSVFLHRLPAGRVRALLPESYVELNGASVSATISIGYAAYTQQDGTAVSADVDAFADGVAFNSGANPALFQLGDVSVADVPEAYPLFDSREGVLIVATRLDSAWVVGDTMKGVISYVND